MPDGVPSFGKFGAKRQKAYMTALAAGTSRATAAERCGVSYELVRLYRKAHPEFADIETDAELKASGLVVDALHLRAVGGDVKAIEFWLCNRDPANWKKQRTIHLDTAKLDDEIRSLMAQLAARGEAVPQGMASGSTAGNINGHAGPNGTSGGNGALPH